MRQKTVWNLISESLEAGIPVMLLYVLESKGSSPGRQGFAMAVNLRNEMAGSIGGGIMEHKFIELAKEQLKENSAVLYLRKQIHDKSAVKNQSGMICSGEQTILLYTVKPEDLENVRKIITSLAANKNGLLRLSPEGLNFEDIVPDRNYWFSFKNDQDWVYEEKTGFKNHLFIIGGGHCALALSMVMSPMDFHIHLFDDRKELNTFLQNDFVQEKKIVDDYGELKQIIPSGENHYVICMTFGYRTDDVAIRALLDKNFKYFGVLGSSAKIKKMFNDYLAEGIPEEKLKKIHSPVGYQIKSQTPQEIAISIAAEIIKIKNEDL